MTKNYHFKGDGEMNVRELEPYRDKIEEMKEKGVCNEDIAKIYHCADMTICRFLRKQVKNFEKKCVICGKKFTPRTSRNVTCSRECGHERAKQMKRELYRKKKGGVVEAHISYQTSQKVTEALSHEDKVKYRLIREYSFDDNCGLIEYTEKGRSPKWIARFFMREIQSVEDQIADLRKSGKYERIRKLMQTAMDNPEVMRW